MALVVDSLPKEYHQLPYEQQLQLMLLPRPLLDQMAGDFRGGMSADEIYAKYGAQIDQELERYGGSTEGVKGNKQPGSGGGGSGSAAIGIVGALGGIYGAKQIGTELAHQIGLSKEGSSLVDGVQELLKPSASSGFQTSGSISQSVSPSSADTITLTANPTLPTVAQQTAAPAAPEVLDIGRTGAEAGTETAASGTSSALGNALLAAKLGYDLYNAYGAYKQGDKGTAAGQATMAGMTAGAGYGAGTAAGTGAMGMSGAGTVGLVAALPAAIHALGSYAIQKNDRAEGFQSEAQMALSPYMRARVPGWDEMSQAQQAKILREAAGMGMLGSIREETRKIHDFEEGEFGGSTADLMDDDLKTGMSHFLKSAINRGLRSRGIDVPNGQMLTPPIEVIADLYRSGELADMIRAEEMFRADLNSGPMHGSYGGLQNIMSQGRMTDRDREILGRIAQLSDTIKGVRGDQGLAQSADVLDPRSPTFGRREDGNYYQNHGVPQIDMNAYKSRAQDAYSNMMFTNGYGSLGSGMGQPSGDPLANAFVQKPSDYAPGGGWPGQPGAAPARPNTFVTHGPVPDMSGGLSSLQQGGGVQPVQRPTPSTLPQMPQQGMYQGFSPQQSQAIQSKFPQVQQAAQGMINPNLSPEQIEALKRQYGG